MPPVRIQTQRANYEPTTSAATIILTDEGFAVMEAITELTKAIRLLANKIK